MKLSKIGTQRELEVEMKPVSDMDFGILYAEAIGSAQILGDTVEAMVSDVNGKVELAQVKMENKLYGESVTDADVAYELYAEAFMDKAKGWGAKAWDAIVMAYQKISDFITTGLRKIFSSSKKYKEIVRKANEAVKNAEGKTLEGKEKIFKIDFDKGLKFATRALDIANYFSTSFSGKTFAEIETGMENLIAHLDGDNSKAGESQKVKELAQAFTSAYGDPKSSETKAKVFNEVLKHVIGDTLTLNDEEFNKDPRAAVSNAIFGKEKVEVEISEMVDLLKGLGEGSIDDIVKKLTETDKEFKEKTNKIKKLAKSVKSKASKYDPKDKESTEEAGTVSKELMESIQDFTGMITSVQNSVTQGFMISINGTHKMFSEADSIRAIVEKATKKVK